jgi:hypothetical protein
MNNKVFVGAVRFRLGLESATNLLSCPCGTILFGPNTNHNGFAHGLSCPKTKRKEVTDTHNSLRDLHREQSIRAGLVSAVEQQSDFNKKRQRPDGYTFFPNGKVFWDVTQRNAVSNTALKAKVPFNELKVSCVLATAFKEKHKSYDQLAEYEGASFLALPIDSFGQLHPEYYNFLRMVAVAAFESGVDTVSAESHLTLLIRETSVRLQRGNFYAILAAARLAKKGIRPPAANAPLSATEIAAARAAALARTGEALTAARQASRGAVLGFLDGLQQPQQQQQQPRLPRSRTDRQQQRRHQRRQPLSGLPLSGASRPRAERWRDHVRRYPWARTSIHAAAASSGLNVMSLKRPTVAIRRLQQDLYDRREELEQQQHRPQSPVGAVDQDGDESMLASPAPAPRSLPPDDAYPPVSPASVSSADNGDDDDNGGGGDDDANDNGGGDDDDNDDNGGGDGDDDANRAANSGHVLGYMGPYPGEDDGDVGSFVAGYGKDGHASDDDNGGGGGDDDDNDDSGGGGEGDDGSGGGGDGVNDDDGDGDADDDIDDGDGGGDVDDDDGGDGDDGGNGRGDEDGGRDDGAPGGGGGAVACASR